MASVADSFEQIFLTYKDVRDANPQWSNQMIEDYLSLKRDVNSVAEESDSAQDQIDVIDAKILVINGRLDDLEALIPVAFYIIANHTVTTNETITCGNVASITITFPLTPINQQRVSVKRTNAEVVINGNGKLVDGESSITLNRVYTGLTFEYSESAGYWSII